MNEYKLADSYNLETVNSCDLCGGSDFEQELSVNGWNLVRCNNCNIVLTTPRYSKSFLQKLYENRYYEKASEYFSTQMNDPSEDDLRLAKFLRKICRRNEINERLRSLDVGCGAGRVVEAFKKEGWDAVGIDLSLRAVSSGIRRGLDVRTDALDNPSLGTFDIITAFHILEHVHSPKTFLQQCAQRLSTTGYLLIEVPDYGSRMAARMGENWPYLYPDSHLYQFTSESLRKYLERTGFTVISLKKNHGRGPLEDYASCLMNRKRPQHRLNNFLFKMRHLIYWSPTCKQMIRKILWNTLGFGEFIQVLAAKSS